MIASRTTFYSKTNPPDAMLNQRGASLMETLLVIALITMMTPFLYGQITETSRNIQNIAAAKKIVKLREPVLNFVRLNQDKWPDTSQIKLDDAELAQITSLAHSGFIDKYLIRGATVTDVYLAFSPTESTLRATKIASDIGADAAIVGNDGIAYGNSWAVAAPEFKPGDLIYRINYDFSDEDDAKYLHRATSGEDDLNVMQRNLNMGKFDLYNVGTVVTDSGKIMDATTAFITSPKATAVSAFFASSATMDGSSVKIGSMRVTGDIMGFRNITARSLNDAKFSTNGNIIADRATVNKSVTVGRNMILKSGTSRTISGFVGVKAHSVATPFLSSDEILFRNNFGLTVSGELLMSTSYPLKIGSWIFPSSAPPKFSDFTLTRAEILPTPNANDFDKIIKSGWKDIKPAKDLQTPSVPVPPKINK